MIKVILVFIIRLLFRVKVVGEFKQEEDRTVIIVNHQSFLDGLLLGLILPISPIFVINTDIAKHPLVRIFLSLSDYLVIDPTKPMAIKSLIRLVESGRPIVIFPEGRITTTGSLMKIYEGSAFVAVKANASIIPIIIQGANFSHFSRMPLMHPRYWFTQITLTYYPATHIVTTTENTSRQRRTQSAEAMRLLMQRCIYESRKTNDLFGTLLDSILLYGASRKIIEDTKQIEYTYRQFLILSLGLGRLMAQYSREGENLGVLMPTTVATLALIFGLSREKRIPAMLNFTAGIDGLQNAIISTKIKTIITSMAFVDQAKLAPKLEALQNVKILYLEELKNELKLWDKLTIFYNSLRFVRARYRHQDTKSPAVILFTSGTEGKPKGVILSHKALLANIFQIRSIVDFSTDDKMLNALPIFHSFGLTAGSLLPILSGMQLYMYPSPLHYRVIPEIAYDRSCTILLGTNTFLFNYAKKANPYDFYRLRYVIAGAEKLSDSVRELWCDKFGLRIFEGYGATETAPVIAVNTPMAYRRGSVGQLLPGIEYKLISITGIDEGGVLHVRGANIMSGYYRSEHPGELEPPTSNAGEGWYDTGDIVTVDNEGFVHIIGRVKRFAKVAGEMISLESVEKLALSVSPTFSHASSSQNDQLRGEAIILFTTDPLLSRDTLNQSAKSQGYPEIAIPRKIVHIDAIPVLGTGKTDYVTLKTMAGEV